MGDMADMVNDDTPAEDGIEVEDEIVDMDEETEKDEGILEEQAPDELSDTDDTEPE